MNQIRENADIEGIIIDETEIKLSAYADDGSFFVTDVQSLQMIFFVCNKGNSVIAVNSDEKVDLENTQLYQKASRSSLT